MVIKVQGNGVQYKWDGNRWTDGYIAPVVVRPCSDRAKGPVNKGFFISCIPYVWFVLWLTWKGMSDSKNDCVEYSKVDADQDLREKYIQR